jgi:hypothetical protein
MKRQSILPATQNILVLLNDNNSELSRKPFVPPISPKRLKVEEEEEEEEENI